jgi:DDE superfamily endonuclease
VRRHGNITTEAPRRRTGGPRGQPSAIDAVTSRPTAHGGNVQVIAAPDGWPIWTSPVRPGREHDTTALRSHAQALPLLAAWTDPTHAVPADLGYEGERTVLTIPIKHRAGRRLTADQRTVNLLHAATRGSAERGNTLLKTTFKALRRVGLCPWRIGASTAAALVLLHHEHGRTT